MTFFRHILVAYCGIPHESRQINRIWVDQFIAGATRKEWLSIVDHTHRFAEALRDRKYQQAADIMNLETAVRRQMTPDVLDDMGIKLIQAAIHRNCGGRFTGAGGGGCIWAIGETGPMDLLRNDWEKISDAKPAGTSSGCPDRSEWVDCGITLMNLAVNCFIFNPK